jgi:opacity protein-like surface antigen
MFEPRAIRKESTMALSLRKLSSQRLSRSPVGAARLACLLTSCLVAGAGASAAHGQASFAGTNVQPFSVFIAGTRLNPDYGSHTNYGFTVGADYTRHYRILDPSLEGRVSHAGGTNVGITSYMGGLRGGREYGRFHPYGDLLLGYGKITFTHPSGQYLEDNSTVFGVGGGLDYDIRGNFAAKGDFQFESWKLGSGNHRQTPTLFSVGVVYRLPIGR